jgi:ATP-dependent helicase HrpA
VTVDVPLALLRDLDAEPFGWHVPALRPAVVAGLIGTLPKAARRRYVPVSDVVDEVLRGCGPEDGPIAEAVARELERIGGVGVPDGLPSQSLLPDHLRITYRVVGRSGREIRSGKDLPELQRLLLRPTLAAIAEERPSVEVTGLVAWTIGSLAREVETTFDGEGAFGYPALVDRGSHVDVAVLRTRDDQAASMTAGTRRLLLLGFDGSDAWRERVGADTRDRLGLSTTTDVDELLVDCADAVVDRVVADVGGPSWDEAGFRELSEHVEARFVELADATVADVAAAVEQGRWIAELLDEATATETEDAVEDLWRQWHRLLAPGFVTRTTAARLARLRAALDGMEERLTRLAAAPARDRQLQRQVTQLEERYDRAAHLDRDGNVRWMIEDLRVALFAPALAARTRTVVDEQTVRRAIDRLRP